MRAFLGVLLLAIVACTAEQTATNEETPKRSIEQHTSNLALLNNLSIESKLAGGVNPSVAPKNEINVGNVNTPSGANVQVTYNTENIPVPSPLPAGLTFGYAPAYAPSYANPALALTGINSIVSNLQLPYGNLPPSAPQIADGVINGIQDSRNIVQTYIPQEQVGVQQSYPFQLIKAVPQPYPVHFTRTVQVPVHVRIPVEVPKPYEVRVPHPVPVPVHIRIPVPVVKPYAVQVTKTIAVPVEKPVYVRIPHPVEVPVPQPYPVPVPQPVHIRVPYPIILRGSESLGAGLPSNLAGVGDINTAISDDLNVARGISGVSTPTPTTTPLIITPPPPTASLSSAVTTGSTTANSQVILKSSLTPIRGNGLLPPQSPGLDAQQNGLSGLLNSYVASKEGGVYRREANAYQTAEYQRNW